MSYIGNERGEVFYVRSMRLFAAGGLFTVLLLSASIDVILKCLTPNSYSSVAEYFPIFAVAALIAECESNLQLGNQIARKTIWISVSSIAYLAVNAGILLWLTDSFGVFAAGLGLAVSALAKGYITYTSAQRHHRIGYDWRAFAILALGCGLLLGLATALHNGWIPSGAFTALTLSLSLLLPWKMLAVDERKRLREETASRYAAWKLSRAKR